MRVVSRASLLLGKPLSAVPVVAEEDLPSHDQVSNLRKFWLQWAEKYGKIFKAPAYLNPGDAIYIHEPDDIKMAYRGKFPSRGPGLVEFNEYLLRSTRWWTKDKQLKAPFFNVNGEYGMKIRHNMQQNLMSPKAVAQVASTFLDTFGPDLIEEVEERAVKHEDRHISANDMIDLTSEFAFEAAGTALFARRLGILGHGHPPTPGAQEWSEIVRPHIMSAVGLATAKDQSWRDGAQTPEWTHYVDCWEKWIAAGESIVETSLKELRTDMPSVLLDCVEKLEKGLFEDEDEMKMAVWQTMAAGVDSTANTLQWAIHNVAIYPEVQRKLREEVLAAMPVGTPVTFEKCQKLPYLKAFFFESFRLTPTIFFGLREATEDIELAGYDIPAGTYLQINQAAAQMDPVRFPNPEEFQVERWLNFNKEEAADAHIKENNFGRGPRMCVGFRLAKAELYIFLANLVRHYDMVPTENYVTPESHYFIVNQPDPAPTVRFIPRA